MQTNPVCGIYSGIFSLLQHVEDVCFSTKTVHSWKSTPSWALKTSSLCLFILLSVIIQKKKKEHKHAVRLSAHTSSLANSNCRWLTFKLGASEGNSLWNAKRWHPKGHAVLMSATAAAAAGTRPLSTSTLDNHNRRRFVSYGHKRGARLDLWSSEQPLCTTSGPAVDAVCSWI